MAELNLYSDALSLADITLKHLRCLPDASHRTGFHNRIHKLAEHVIRHPEPFRKDDETWRVAGIALRDLTEWLIIFNTIGECLKEDDFRQAATDAQLDPILPPGRQAEQPGREAQWELLIAAKLIQAGYYVTRPSDEAHTTKKAKSPDWLAFDDTSRIAVECKRLRSKRSFITKSRSAAMQLGEVSIPGILAVEYTQSLDSYLSRQAGDSLQLLSRKIDDRYGDEVLAPYIQHRLQSLIPKLTCMSRLGSLDHLFVSTSYYGFTPCPDVGNRPTHFMLLFRKAIASNRPAVARAAAIASNRIASVWNRFTPQ